MDLETFEDPKRNLILSAAPEEVSDFEIKNTFLRDDETGVDSLRKEVIAMENLLLEGTIEILSSLKTNKTILCVKYTEDCSCVAGGFTDGIVRLFKCADGQVFRTLFDLEIQENTSPVTSIKHRPVSKNYPIVNCLTCTYANGYVKSWNYNYGQCIYTIREKRQTYGIAYHPRLPKFITYGDDLKIYMYDEETRTQERILSASQIPGSIDGHASRIFAACFNPRSNHEFITGGWDDVVYFWDVRQPHAIRHLSQIHMCGEGLDISHRGTEVLTCAWQKENPLQVYDYASGELIVTMEPDGHESLLYCGKFLNKDYAIVGGSDKSTFRIIDLQTYSTVGSITGLIGGVYDLDAGPSKKSKPKDKEESISKIQEVIQPKIAFVSGNALYQVSFS
ncbi:hypothetical protein FQR65_LT11229 [Abscondita terminalis]|nr:hypothetical protein FQR65_LT11229 [Abscondita terminalis]